MKVYGIFISIIIFVAGFYSGYLYGSNQSIARAEASIKFDHSQCQYPNRASNPPDGCDNSDPARPECMKLGAENCDEPQPDTTKWVDTTVKAITPVIDTVTEVKKQLCQ